MRVLHLTPEVPAPAGTGGAIRQFELLRRLPEAGHDVTVVAPVTPEQEARMASLREVGVGARGVRRPAHRVAEAARALVLRPDLAANVVTRPVLAWQVSVFWAHLRPAALSALEEQPPDVVSVEHDYAAAWIADLPRAPAVLTLHNVSWHYYARRAAAARRPAALALSLEARRFRRYGSRHLDRYARLITVSERDRVDVAPTTSAPVAVVPNGVHTEGIVPAPEEPGPPTAVFIGTMSYPPNAEGILWFVKEAWPLVMEARPDARLVIVGRRPPRQVMRLTRQPGIEVTGEVPDVVPYLRRAAAVVVPLRSGGGTRLKVLEAMAAGRPVVATGVGVEGLDLEPASEFLCADEPAAFATAVAQLFSDAELRRTLAAAGRAAVERRYDWRVLAERFEAVLHLAADAR